MQRGGMASLIGAVLGLVYILVNAAKLPDTPAITLRILAILVFVAVYLAIRHLPASDDDDDARAQMTSQDQAGEEPVDHTSRAWAVIGAELVVAVAGVALIAGPLHHEEASVAWISLVFGVHLVLMYRDQVRALGGAIAACGAVGTVLAFAGASDESVATIGGILPGAILLGASWWAAWQAHRSSTQRA